MGVGKASTKALSVPASRVIGGVFGGAVSEDAAGSLGALAGKVLPFAPKLATRALGSVASVPFDVTPIAADQGIIPSPSDRQLSLMRTGSPVGEALSTNANKANIIEATKINQGQQMVKGLEELQSSMGKMSAGGQTNIIQSGGNTASSGDWPPVSFVDDPLAQLSVGILNLIRGG
jgi:hypothetical protein